MTLLLEALDAKLRTITDLTAFVGNRIFGNRAPQWTPAIQKAYSGPLPMLVYQDSTVEQHRHLEGSDGSAQIAVTFDIFAATYLQAKQVAEILRVNFDTFRGSLSGMAISEMTLESMNDFYDQPIDGSDVGANVVSMDFFVWHEQVEASP